MNGVRVMDAAPRTVKAAGYSAEVNIPSVFKLAPPDPEPLPARTRTLRVVDGDTETEIDPTTGDVIAERPLQLANQEAEPCHLSKS